MAYGSDEWGSLKAHSRAGMTKVPRSVQAAREMKLFDRVNPLLFMYGPPSAWFAYGTEAERGQGCPTADVMGLKPAPLGRFFRGAVKEDKRGQWAFDSSQAGLLPTFSSGLAGVPTELQPYKTTSDSKTVYWCGFPGCRAPANCQSHGNQNKQGVLYHLLVDHLGLIPVCVHCRRPQGTKLLSNEHKKKCPEYRDLAPKRSDDKAKGNLYGFVMAAEWELWGAQPEWHNTATKRSSDMARRQQEFDRAEAALRDTLRRKDFQ